MNIPEVIPAHQEQEKIDFALEMAHLNCPYCQNGSTPLFIGINGLFAYWHYNNEPLRPSWDMCHSSRIRTYVQNKVEDRERSKMYGPRDQGQGHRHAT